MHPCRRFFQAKGFLISERKKWSSTPVQVIGKCYTGATSSPCQLRLSKYHQTCMYIFFSLHRREVRTVKVKWECITHGPLFIYSSSFFLLALHVTVKDQFCSSFVLICRTQNVGYLLLLTPTKWIGQTILLIGRKPQSDFFSRFSTLSLLFFWLWKKNIYPLLLASASAHNSDKSLPIRYKHIYTCRWIL